MTGIRLTRRMRVVYDAMMVHGQTGAMPRQLLADLGGKVTDKALAAMLKRMLALGLAEQVVPRGPYIAVHVAREDALLTHRDRCLAVVADCPGGVSDAVVAEETGLTVDKVRRVLEVCLRSGEVLRVRMPATHGGGKGYALGKPPVQPIKEGPAADAGVRGAFDLVDDNTRLALAWDGARIVLPASVTRGLFRFLDALGGLQNEQRLNQAEGGAA